MNFKVSFDERHGGDQQGRQQKGQGIEDEDGITSEKGRHKSADG